MASSAKMSVKNSVASIGGSFQAPDLVKNMLNSEKPRELFTKMGSNQAGAFASAQINDGKVSLSAGATFPSMEKIKALLSTIFDTGYIDMGLFEQVLNSAITWTPTKAYPNGYYETQKLNAALDVIFDPLVKLDGTNKINLSFAQICNIAAILDPDVNTSYSGTDKILEILTYNPRGNNPAFNKPIDQNGKKLDTDIIGYLISYANTKKIKTDLSFGGAIASNSDYVIKDPVQSANDLVAIMDNYNIDSVDFDIENIPGLMNNGETKVLSFFKTLHSALAAKNKKLYLTLMGSTSNNGPASALKPIFDNFDACADGVRLMMYSTAQFYIDANNQDWGLNTWKNIVKDPSEMSIGFYDKIPYETPQSSDPAYSAEKYEGFPTNPTRGQAAAWIYKKVLSDMGLTPDQFDEPFWWTDDPNSIPSDKFISDFYEYLNKTSKSVVLRFL